MPMTDDEARDLSERVFEAMGWTCWDKENCQVWSDGRGNDYQDDETPNGLPDIRTNACLPFLLDWLDGQTQAGYCALREPLSYCVRRTNVVHGPGTRLQYSADVGRVYHVAGAWEVREYGDSMGEALGRAVVALCAARDTGRQEAENG